MWQCGILGYLALAGLVWTLFRVINELMLISRLEMTRHSVGGCLSRLSRDHLILISDRGSQLSYLLIRWCWRPQPTLGIRHQAPAPGTCPALAPVSLHSLADSCLGNVSSPWDSNTSSGNPFHDIIILLMRCYLLLLHCYSAHSTCYSVQFGIILCFQQGFVFHADSHEH